MINRRKSKSTVTELRAPPASRMQSGRARVMRAAAFATAGLATVGLVLTGVFVGGGRGDTHLPWASGVYLPSATPASVAAFGTWRGTPVASPPSGRTPRRGVTSQIRPGSTSAGREHRKHWSSGSRCCPRASRECPSRRAPTARTTPTGSSSVLTSRPTASASRSSGWAGNSRELVPLAGHQPDGLGGMLAADRHLGANHRPGLQWDWNVNRGKSAGLADPTQAYPGDAYVDTIGVDSYDMWPPATTSANWTCSSMGHRA